MLAVLKTGTLDRGYCWHIKGRVTILKTGTLSIAGTVRMLVSLLFDRPRRIPFPGSSALHCSSRCSSSSSSSSRTSWSDEECAERAVPLLAIPSLQSHSFSPFNTPSLLQSHSSLFLSFNTSLLQSHSSLVLSFQYLSPCNTSLSLVSPFNTSFLLTRSPHSICSLSS